MSRMVEAELEVSQGKIKDCVKQAEDYDHRVGNEMMMMMMIMRGVENRSQERKEILFSHDLPSHHQVIS